jgi:hypothetical protein
MRQFSLASAPNAPVLIRQIDKVFVKGTTALVSL